MFPIWYSSNHLPVTSLCTFYVLIDSENLYMWKDSLVREYPTRGFICFRYVTHKTTFFSFMDSLHMRHIQFCVHPIGKSSLPKMHTTLSLFTPCGNSLHSTLISWSQQKQPGWGLFYQVPLWGGATYALSPDDQLDEQLDSPVPDAMLLGYQENCLAKSISSQQLTFCWIASMFK